MPDVIRGFGSQRKWLFAIYHGIQVFNAADIVRGRMVNRAELGIAPEFYREVMACLGS